MLNKGNILKRLLFFLILSITPVFISPLCAETTTQHNTLEKQESKQQKQLATLMALAALFYYGTYLRRREKKYRLHLARLALITAILLLAGIDTSFVLMFFLVAIVPITRKLEDPLDKKDPLQ